VQLGGRLRKAWRQPSFL